MLFVYYKDNLNVLKRTININEEIPENTLWVDLFNFNLDEIAYIENNFNIKIPNDDEKYNIEESARYQDVQDTITINNVFLNKDALNQTTTTKDTITFLLNKKVLFTIRA